MTRALWLALCLVTGAPRPALARPGYVAGRKHSHPVHRSHAKKHKTVAKRRHRSKQHARFAARLP